MSAAARAQDAGAGPHAPAQQAVADAAVPRAAPPLAADASIAAVVPVPPTAGDPPPVPVDDTVPLPTDDSVSLPTGDTLQLPTDDSVSLPTDDVAPGPSATRRPPPPPEDVDAGVVDGADVGDAGAEEGLDAGIDNVGVADAGLALSLAAPPEPAPPAGHGRDLEADASNVVKTMLGLVALLALAVLGAHPRVRRLERLLNISQLITAGFPFVAMGLIARHPAVGVLDDDVLRELDPLLQLGLGWIGFLTGYQFEAKQFDAFPRGTARLVVLMSVTPFVAVVVACGGLVLAFGQPWESAIFLRDAVVLGAAATITAPIAASVAAARGLATRTHAVLTRLGLLDDIAGVVGLLFLGAYFRPESHGGWMLPGTAWLFVTLGLGIALGVVLYVVMNSPVKGIQQITLVIGSIAFSAGYAGYLHVSPVVVCFIAGAILGNLPGEYRQPVRRVLRLLERPIYLVFLVFAGALWKIGDWHGWVLVPAFVAARLVGRAIGLRLARRGVDSEPAIFEGEQGMVASPMGALSIAIVVSFQSLFSGPAVPWIVTAVIGGAMVTEVFVQVSLLGGSAGSNGPTTKHSPSVRPRRLEVR